MALYCAKARRWAAPASLPLRPFPFVDTIFDTALKASPDRARGVSFDAMAAGMEAEYGRELEALSSHFVTLPNSSMSIRGVLLRGCPVIIGYQVNAPIDRFHSDAALCERLGYVLPRFSLAPVSLSGHAVLILGYDFKAGFIARNSWGHSWGVDGHFLIPFDVADDPAAATDVWALVPKR
jgi:hypothetical protein